MKEKVYVIGIRDIGKKVLEQVKAKHSSIITVLLDDNKYNKSDIFIKYYYGYNDYKGKGYKGIALDLLDSVKEQVEDLFEKVNKNDKVIIFNNLINTGSLEMFYYLCEKFSNKCDNCYVIVCNGYSFLGKYRLAYNNDILDKLYKLNCHIYELDGDEVSKIKNATNVTTKAECVSEEFINYINNIIENGNVY